MISKRDTKPFLVKFVVGNNTDEEDTTPVYGKYQVLSGLISDPTGRINPYIYGLEENYDRVLIVNANDTSRQIDYNTAILIDEYPTAIFEEGNYKIKRIYPEYNREIVIGLEKMEGVALPMIYYKSGNSILSFQLNYDKKTKEGYVDRNRYIPFAADSVIWSKEPAGISSNKNRIVLTSIDKVGVDDMHNYFKKLTFGAYSNNG